MASMKMVLVVAALLLVALALEAAPPVAASNCDEDCVAANEDTMLLVPVAQCQKRCEAAEQG